MKKLAFSIVFLSLFTLSCKKNYTCTCTNSVATYDAGEVEKTKSQAKKYCQDLSSGDTKCGLK